MTSQLRKQLRKQRLQLSKCQRNQYAYQSIRRLSRLQHSALKNKNAKVGIFVDAFGEMPTQPLMAWARKRGFRIYLPVVTSSNKPLVFIEFNQQTWLHSRLPRHPLGMRQPVKGKALKASELDILFMPLVSADKFGNRMGMGGGYYDRTLAKTKRKPLKIGWAYDFQLVERLDSNPWDIKLDVLITPCKLWLFLRYLIEQKTMPNNDKTVKSNFTNLFDSVEDNMNINDQTIELSHTEIASVMNIDRLNRLLAQADAFTRVNSEDLDEF